MDGKIMVWKVFLLDEAVQASDTEENQRERRRLLWLSHISNLIAPESDR